MNENEQRDELARELFIADNSNQPREASIVDWEWFESTDKQRGQLEHYKNMAAGMIAAGYSKPRTITTVEELDALPMGAAVLDSRRTVWVNDGDTVAPWASLGEGNYEGGPIWVSSVDIALPATVLHEPGAEVAA